MKKSHVSLKDIAKELNLSISTVSRAIRNIGEISPETKKVVLELAEKWNYKPNPLAMAAMKVNKESGLKIPENIAVVGFNDDPFSSFLEPSLTTVSQPAYLMGMKAMEKILQMITRDIEINLSETIVMESALVIRESTKKL